MCKESNTVESRQDSEASDWTSFLKPHKEAGEMGHTSGDRLGTRRAEGGPVVDLGAGSII